MPQFQHDCSACTFLGSVIDTHARECDLYVCPSEDDHALIARFSDEPSDNASTSVHFARFRGDADLLHIAFLLAQRRGLLSP